MHTSLYGKPGDFNFDITNFPFLWSNISSSPAYSVLSHNSYSMQGLAPLINVYSEGGTVWLLYKLPRQEYARERLKSFLKKFYCRMGISSNNIKSPSPQCCMTFWDMTIYPDTLRWSGISLNGDIVTNRSYYRIPVVFIEHLQPVRLGRFLLRTPDPVTFGTWIFSYVETILSWTYPTSGLRFSNISRYFYFA